MAAITRIPSGYRVQIRRKGYPVLSKNFPTKKSAEAWAREYDREGHLVSLYALERGRTKTVKDLLDKYMAEYQGRDISKVRQLAWWRGEIGDIKLVKLDENVIADAIEALKEGKAQRGNGKGKVQTLEKRRSPSTVNRYLSSLSAAFEAARDWRWLKDNPARKIRKLKEPRGRVRFLSDGEREALLKACRESEWRGLYPLVLLALSTGARAGELMSLTWDRMDLDRGLAYLEDTKNNERRVLPLVGPVVAELKRWRKVRRINSNLVFPSDRLPGQPFNFRKPWDRALRAAEIENFRFHDTRHSCASYLAMQGATLLEIADVLGHKTLAMVQRYAHLSTDHKKALLERTTGKMLEG